MSKEAVSTPPVSEKLEEETLVIQKKDHGEPMKEMKSLDLNTDNLKLDTSNTTYNVDESKDSVPKALEENPGNDDKEKDSEDKTNGGVNIESKALGEMLGNDGQKIDESKETLEEERDQEPVFDGTEIPGMEANRSTSIRSLDLDLDTQKVVEKAVALKNLVKEKGEKSAVVVSNFLRRLSGKKDEDGQDVAGNADKDVSESAMENSAEEVPQKTSEKSSWNPLSYLAITRGFDAENTEVAAEEPAPHVAMRGRIILYTRLGCKESKETRLFLHGKRLKYVEINIDVYPSRKMELEKIAGSSVVPKVFFNEILIGGLTELKSLDELGKLNEKIDYLVTEAASFEAPLPPLSGEDDMSNSGALDEQALIVRKMKESIVPRDRFYKMRRFTSCFLGSEAVDFISEDQYLEREEVSRNLAL